MSERTFVVIFFFWALLIIITPTLVHLSETSKHALDSEGKKSDEIMKVRKFAEHIEEHHITKTIALPPTQEISPAPAPAPESTDDQGQANKEADLYKFFSETRRSLISKTKHNITSLINHVKTIHIL